MVNPSFKIEVDGDDARITFDWDVKDEHDREAAKGRFAYLLLLLMNGRLNANIEDMLRRAGEMSKDNDFANAVINLIRIGQQDINGQMNRTSVIVPRPHEVFRI